MNIPFADRLSSLLKTDTKYVFSSGSWLVLSETVAILSSFALSVFLAKILSRESYGTYKYFFSIFGMLNVTTLAGMSTAVSQAVANGNDSAVFSGLKIKMKFGFAGLFFGLVLSAYYFIMGRPDLASIVFLISFFVPFFDPLGVYWPFLQGKTRFDLIFKYEAPLNLLSTVFLISLSSWSGQVVVVILGYLSFWTLARLLIFILSTRNIKNDSKINGDSSSLLSNGLHLSAVRVIDSVGSYADKVILWSFLGPAAVALYSVALSIPSRLGVVSKIISNLAFPKMAKQDYSTLAGTYSRKMIQAGSVSFVLAVFYIITASLIFGLIYPTYPDGVALSKLAALKSIFILPGTILATAFVAHTRKKELYSLRVSSVIFYLMLLSSLTYFFGVWGAILAGVVSAVFDMILAFILAKIFVSH
ncbi:MAG: oligosaccharide flippase family protein [Candidatus Paceibacterota bacterium]|jgi:O-antigen/teichoic acid export membrane protein